MAGPMNQSADAWQVDADTRTMLFDGLTVSQLAVAFGLGPQVVARRLVAVQPSGRRGRFATYKLKDAAPYLVEAPVGDFEERIKRMNHRDLPPMLLKEFWTGLRARQAYELEERDLWKTGDVVAMLAEVFKSVRMSLLLMSDTLERETSLDETQRNRLQDIVDATLEDAYARLVGNFSNGHPPAEAPRREPEPADTDEWRGL